MKRVTEVTARIRPHGYFVAETKSKLTHNKVTARHSANLLYALMTEAPANSTPDVLNEAHSILGRCKCIPDDPFVREMFGGLFCSLAAEHSVIDGMTMFVQMAAADPDLFEFLFLPLNDGTFEISNYHFCEFKIPLYWSRINYVKGEGPTSEEECKAAGLPSWQFVSVDYEGGTPCPPMEKITRIWLDVFHKLGSALHSEARADEVKIAMLRGFARGLRGEDQNGGGGDA